MAVLERSAVVVSYLTYCTGVDVTRRDGVSFDDHPVDPIWLNALSGPRVSDDRNRNSIASEIVGVHIISYPTTSSVQFS